jgi:uncharacterized protein (TIGR02284 family)
MAAEDKDLNRDPITDEPGAHPVGTGIGAAGGAMAGAAAGAIGGPIGAAVGGVVGAVVGGLAGKAAGEAVNPTAEEAYWKDNYTREPYYDASMGYDDYAPAYRLGLTGRTRYEGDFDAAEPRLAAEWDEARAGSRMEWKQAQPATRAAWHRIDSQRGMDTNDTSAGVKTGGAAAAMGRMQSAGNESGDHGDVIDALQDLVECCKDGEYGFRACADQAKRADLKSTFAQRAEDCRGAAQELNEQIRMLGGKTEDSGSVAGAAHRGWVAVKTVFTSYDDKAVLEEAERGEDNAKARYTKALKQTMPAGVKLVVERQMQGVQRNHDQMKMLRDQFRAAS